VDVGRHLEVGPALVPLGGAGREPAGVDPCKKYPSYCSPICMFERRKSQCGNPRTSKRRCPIGKRPNSPKVSKGHKVGTGVAKFVAQFFKHKLT
jgi:hypothetical protein